MLITQCRLPEQGKIIKGNERYYTMTKGSILQEHVKIFKVYAPNNRMSKYIIKKLLELLGEIEKSTITVGDFNTSLSVLPTVKKSVRL